MAVLKEGDEAISIHEYDGAPAGTRCVIREVQDRVYYTEIRQGDPFRRMSSSWYFSKNCLIAYPSTPFDKAVREYIDGELAG